MRQPDGVQIGTEIPFGKTWPGYTCFTHGDFNSAWRTRITVNTAKIQVTLFMTSGQVTRSGSTSAGTCAAAVRDRMSGGPG